MPTRLATAGTGRVFLGRLVAANLALPHRLPASHRGSALGLLSLADLDLRRGSTGLELRCRRPTARRQRQHIDPSRSRQWTPPGLGDFIGAPSAQHRQRWPWLARCGPFRSRLRHWCRRRPRLRLAALDDHHGPVCPGASRRLAIDLLPRQEHGLAAAERMHCAGFALGELLVSGNRCPVSAPAYRARAAVEDRVPDLPQHRVRPVDLAGDSPDLGAVGLGGLGDADLPDLPE